LIFVPSQKVRICGFSTFAASQDDKYDMKYRVKINDQIVEEEQIVASGWEEELYYRHTLNGIYPAQPGEKIELTVWIAKNLSSYEYVTTYSGSTGNGYEEVPNEHMGLFKIEASNDSGNGTSLYGGHFPEIFYHLG